MRLRLLAACLLAGLGCPEAGAQTVAVVGGSVQITVPVVGSVFGTGVSNTTSLSWSGALLLTVHKITAQTSVAGQNYGLTVLATPTAYGTSAGTVTLTSGAAPMNLIVDIPPNPLYLLGERGTAPLRYEATATAANPAGQDLHTVVYTITQQ